MKAAACRRSSRRVSYRVAFILRRRTESVYTLRMPNIVDYLTKIRSARSYDEVELARLQLVYDRACKTQAIDVGDPRREAIARLVFQAADLSSEPDEMLDRVLGMYRRPA